MKGWQQWLMLIAGVSITASSAVFAPSAIALNEELDWQTQILLSNPFDPNLLNGDEPRDPNVISAFDISQSGLTVPSLWWLDQQFGGKLLTNWFAFPAEAAVPPRIDLVVNAQVWSLYNYMERYSFVNQFGTAGNSYGYNTRVFDRQGNLLAAYVCEFEDNASTAVVVQSGCSIFMDGGGRSGLTGQTAAAASGANTVGTARR
ncbi:hypothetical protein ACQ4M4_03330 [Leptolyngbya sp. AN02str]|uniref:hypothetical protein n=1 Tax=Leptolyngbya sp. AN02str TaxID=3423363 RepID=UPI003D31F786